MATNKVTDGGTLYGTGANSSIDKSGTPQIRQEYYDKKAIIDIKDEMIFSQMSSTMGMPKHFGKEIVKHRYIPLVDDENTTSLGIDKDGAAISNGNLYGSSRDIGAIEGAMPDLSETGGRVNRVGFTRKEVRASIKNRGFFFEWTKDSMAFDTDAQMKQHLTTEAVRGANRITEDGLAIDLVNGAGVVYYAGGASIAANGTVTYSNTFGFDAGTASGTTPDYETQADVNISEFAILNKTSIPTMRDLIRLDTELDNNKCPRDTKVITGSTMVDTKTVAGARYMFISPDVKMEFMSIKALNGTDDAFVPVEQYQGASGSSKHIKTIHGEIGKVGPFRIVVAPKMVKRAGVGADASNSPEYRQTNNKFDVYPCLVIGSESFTHLGFEMGAGSAGKFKTKTRTPEQNIGTNDPYGKTGFTSIEFWTGVLIERPEWICTYNVVARY